MNTTKVMLIVASLIITGQSYSYESRCEYATDKSIVGTWQSVDLSEAVVYQIDFYEKEAVLIAASISGDYIWSAKSGDAVVDNGIIHGTFTETNPGKYSAKPNEVRVAGTGVSCTGIDKARGTLYLVLDGFVRHFFAHSRTFSKVTTESLAESIAKSQKAINKERDKLTKK